MKMIVGLGNPGKNYEKTRHNIGFRMIDEISHAWHIPVTKEKWNGSVGEGFFRSEKIILLKPLTYMNRSGESVRRAMDWLKIDISDILVIYDDLDLPVGQIRLRQKGGSGGQNGIKSLIQHLGTEVFNRIRIGIGRPITRQSAADYVLSSFAKEEAEPIATATQIVREAAVCWIESDFLKAMNQYNVK